MGCNEKSGGPPEGARRLEGSFAVSLPRPNAGLGPLVELPKEPEKSEHGDEDEAERDVTAHYDHQLVCGPSALPRRTSNLCCSPMITRKPPGRQACPGELTSYGFGVAGTQAGNVPSTRTVVQSPLAA